MSLFPKKNKVFALKHLVSMLGTSDLAIDKDLMDNVYTSLVNYQMTLRKANLLPAIPEKEVTRQPYKVGMQQDKYTMDPRESSLSKQ